MQVLWLLTCRYNFHIDRFVYLYRMEIDTKKEIKQKRSKNKHMVL